MAATDFADYINRQIYELNLTKTEVAKRAGISRQALYKLLNMEVEEAKLSTFIRLAHALEVHPLDLIRRLLQGWQMPIRSPKGTKYPRDYSGFVRDVTIPDNDIVSVNQQFEKIREIQNIGEVEWNNRRLVCVDDELFLLRKNNDKLIPLSPQNLLPVQREVLIPTTRSQKKVCISVIFRAPPYPCTTISYWKMIDSEGNLCFPGMEGLWCKVKVVAI